MEEDIHFDRQVTLLRAQIMNLVRRLRQEAGQEDLPFSKLSLLGAIDRLAENATPSALARAEGMLSSNLAALLRGLESDGYIVRQSDAVDKRISRISLTEHGYSALQGHRSRREQWLSDGIRLHLTDVECRLLFEAGRLMERLAVSGKQADGKTDA